MYKKAVFVSALIALVCVQLASSLSCYQCTSPSDCKKPRKTVCTNNTANETSHYLGVYHQNVPNVTSTRFDCLKLVYTYPNNNTVTHQLHGCVHPNANACGLTLRPEYSRQNWRKTVCNICSGDNCNKSPAGTFSTSTYTILITMVGLFLAKVYA